MSTQNIISKIQRLPPMWVAVALGVLITLWSIAQNPVLNDDAYQYLRAAQMVAHGDAGAMYAQNPWFHYSVLIAALDRLLPGDALASARVLNLLLQALLMAVFVALAQRLYPGRRTALLAALTLLLYPQLNELRFAVIRDFGFWSFALWSLLLLLQYRDSKRIAYAIGWVATLLIAALFRLEALLLMAVTPLALIRREHRRQCLSLYGLLLALVITCEAVCALLQIDMVARMEFSYRYYLPELYALPASLVTDANILMGALFADANFPGSGNTVIGLGILLLAYGFSLAVLLVQALSVPVTLLLLHAVWRRWWHPLKDWRGPHMLYASCAKLSLLLFMALMHFLTERYTMLLCLLLLLHVPPVLNRWIDHVQSLGNKLPYRILAGFFIVYYLTDSLVSFGTYPRQLPQALTWLQQHPSEGSALLTNNAYLAYGSGRVDHYDAVRTPLAELLTNAQSGSVLAVAVDAGDTEDRSMLAQDARLTILEHFANSRGDEVFIYRRQ